MKKDEIYTESLAVTKDGGYWITCVPHSGLGIEMIKWSGIIGSIGYDLPDYKSRAILIFMGVFTLGYILLGLGIYILVTHG